MMTRKFVVLAAAAAMVALALCAAAEAQPGRSQRDSGRGSGGSRFGGFSGFSGFGTGALQLARREDVQKELKLTDAQKEQLTKLSEGDRNQSRQGFDFSALREASDDERRAMFARFGEQRQERQKASRGKVSEILNSSQRSRFAQLEFQYNLRRGSITGALTAAGVDLDEQKKEKLQKTQEEVNNRTREQVAKIQRDARMEILGSVVESSQIKRLTGEPFTFESGLQFRPGQGRDRGGDRTSGRPSRPEPEGAGSDRPSSSRRRREN